MNQSPMYGLLVETFPDGLDLCHASSQTDDSDFVEISRLTMSQLLRPQELRFPDAEYPDPLRISDMHPNGWMVQMTSRGSRLIASDSLDLRNRFPDSPTLVRFLTPVPLNGRLGFCRGFHLGLPRYTERRWRLISTTCPLPTDGPDPCRDFETCDVSVLTTSRIPISRVSISRWLNLVPLLFNLTAVG
jgi:hypothetical protein